MVSVFRTISLDFSAENRLIEGRFRFDAMLAPQMSNTSIPTHEKISVSYSEMCSFHHTPIQLPPINHQI